MSKIIQVQGVVKSSKLIKDSKRTVATVDFGRTNDAGFKLLDSVFLPKDKSIQPVEHVFSLIFNVAGEVIHDIDGNVVYVEDEKGKPTTEVRTFKTDSIFAVGFEPVESMPV